MIKLEEKLYTSTEVAQILGVSLRSVYRYIEEEKLNAEVKTATGRHRFTKRDILEFLYPGGVQESEEGTRKVPVSTKVTTEISTSKVKEPAEEKEEQVDWLSKFREAASKFREEEASKVEVEPVKEEAPKSKEEFSGLAGVVAEEASEKPEEKVSMYYYRSGLGGLKDIAQSIDKNSRDSGIPYAFTLNAGLSLHAPIKPFSILHAYVKPYDREFFEDSLMLSPVDASGAQLCLLVSDEEGVYSDREELHGLYVVSKDRLKEDVNSFGDMDLKQEVENVIK